MSDNARSADVTQAHDLVIANVKVAKADVVSRLEGGIRDWPELRASVEKYIDFQTAADVLDGSTKMEKT